MSYFKYQIIYLDRYGYGMIKNSTPPYDILFFDGTKKKFYSESLDQYNNKSKVSELTLKEIVQSPLFDNDLKTDIDSIEVSYEDIYSNVKIESNYIQKIFTKNRPILIKIEYKNDLLLVDNYNSSYIKESIAKLIKIARTIYQKEDEKKAQESKEIDPLKETFNKEIYSSKSFLEKYIFLKDFFKNSKLNKSFFRYLDTEFILKSRKDIKLDEKTYLLLLTFFFYDVHIYHYFITAADQKKKKSINYYSIHYSFELIKDIIERESRDNLYLNYEQLNRIYGGFDHNVLLMMLASNFKLNIDALGFFMYASYSEDEVDIILKTVEDKSNLEYLKLIFAASKSKELEKIPLSYDILNEYFSYVYIGNANPSTVKGLVNLITTSPDKDLKELLIYNLLNYSYSNKYQLIDIKELLKEYDDYYLNELYNFRTNKVESVSFDKYFDSLNQLKSFALHLFTQSNDFIKNEKIIANYTLELEYFTFEIKYQLAKKKTLMLYSMKIDLESLNIEVDSNLGKDATKNLLNYVTSINNVSLKLISFFNKFENHNKELNNKSFYDELSNLSLDSNKPLSKIEVYLDLVNDQIIHKIGIDKFYKIRDIERFISNLNGYGSESIQYSKYFTFYYDYDNLDELSKKYIYYLNSLNGRIKLNNDFLDNLFKIFKGNYIYINDEKYLVKLDSLDKKILIKNDYTFEYDKLNDNYEFILDSTYCFNKITREINMYSSSELTKKLLPLIKKYNPNIKNYIEDFKYKYYLNSEDEFNLENNIDSIFKKKELIINSYYTLNKDYEISVKDELELNGSKVYFSSLNPYLQNVYNVYLSILNDLGFINNKLPAASLMSFLKADLSRLRKISNVYLDEKIQKLKLKDFTSPTFTSDISSGVMQVIKSESVYSDEELFKIFKSLEKNSKFVILNDDVIDLTSEDSKKFKELVEDYNLDNKKSLDFEKKLPLYYAFKNNSLINSSSINKYYEDFNDELKNYKDISKVNLKVNATLRDYQKEAYNWLNIIYKYNLGGILADDMGLGKTLEVISFISTLDIDKPILIVSPTSLIFNWINEFNKFLPSYKLIPIYGKEELRKSTIASIQNKIYITSYDTLRNDLESYKDIEFKLIVLDEAQFIKNSNSKKSQSVKEIKADHKLVLTGTPIENSVSDLWSLFDFLMPGFFPNESEFKSRYTNDEYYRKAVKKRVTPFILKRTKENSLNDLPSKEEIIMTSTLSSEERKVYEATRVEAKNILNKSKDFISILGYLTILREICIDPSLVYSNFNYSSSKLELMEKIALNEISKGNRILIFSQFVKALSKIEDKLNANNIKYLYIDGQTKSEDRVAITNEFNNDESIKVCVISLKAGGTGLNLTGANIVIHLDPWWNYSKEAQASDRVYRIGQTKDVKVYKLVSENTVEENVIYLQNMKKELANEILSDSDKMTKLTKEDLMFLLNNE